MIERADNYHRYPKDNNEDLLATSGIFRIIHRFLSHKITLREAIEEALALYEYRKKTAVRHRVRYYFLAAVLAVIRLFDRLEKESTIFIHVTIRQRLLSKITAFARKVTHGLFNLKRIIFVLPGVILDPVRELFSSIKDTRSEHRTIRRKKKKELESYKTPKSDNFVVRIRDARRYFSSRRTAYFVFSIAIHIAIFYFLRFYDFRDRQKLPDTFEMHAIQLVNTPPQAQNKISTKGDEKHGGQKRERSSEKPGQPKIEQSPKTDVRSVKKETVKSMKHHETAIKEIAQKEPDFQDKTLSKAETQARKHQVALSKNLAIQQRTRTSTPTIAKAKKTFRTKTVMQRRPISPRINANKLALQKDYTVIKSSLSRTLQPTLNPQFESSNFTPGSLSIKTPALNQKKAIAPKPEEARFEKFITGKIMELEQKRTNLTRTHLEYNPKEILRKSKIAFRKISIEDVAIPEGENADIEIRYAPKKPDTAGEALSGIKKNEQIHTGLTITLRTPLMRDGFTIGDIPNESLRKEKMIFSGPLRRAEMESQKGVSYYGREAKVGPISFMEERITYNSKSRKILKRVKATTDELGNIEELDDFSEERRPSPVSKLKTIAKQTLTPAEKFTTSTSSQYFQGVEKETEQEIPGKKLIAQAKISARKQDATAHKMLAYKTDKGVKQTFKKEVGKKSTTLDSQPSPEKKITKSGKIDIKVDLPKGYITQKALYTLRGEVGSDVKQAFVTTNDVTQMVTVKDGVFVAKVAMIKGINKINVLAFSSKGKMGNRAFKILFRPRRAIPIIRLLSPQNGKQGLKEGDMIMVSGTINDKSIKQAILVMNNSRIKVKVKNGRIKHKIFLPGTRVNTFRISATAKNGMIGYSPLHTILIGASFDINNPRPY